MDYTGMPADELVRTCAQSNAAPAWEEFIRRFNPVIARVVIRTAARWGEVSRSTLDDLIQETYLKLCAENGRLLRTFDSRHPHAIYGYLKVVTANVVHDYLKGARAAKRGASLSVGGVEIDETETTDPSETSLETAASMDRTILLKEIDQHLVRSIPAVDVPRSRLIFWLYYRSGLSASAIASLPRVGLTTKGVESALLRLTRAVKASLLEESREHGGQQQRPSQD